MSPLWPEGSRPSWGLRVLTYKMSIVEKLQTEKRQKGPESWLVVDSPCHRCHHLRHHFITVYVDSERKQEVESTTLGKVRSTEAKGRPEAGWPPAGPTEEAVPGSPPAGILQPSGHPRSAAEITREQEAMSTQPALRASLQPGREMIIYPYRETEAQASVVCLRFCHQASDKAGTSASSDNSKSSYSRRPRGPVPLSPASPGVHLQTGSFLPSCGPDGVCPHVFRTVPLPFSVSRFLFSFFSPHFEGLRSKSLDGVGKQKGLLSASPPHPCHPELGDMEMS